MIATEDVSAVLNLNQPHAHTGNFSKLFITFTLVLEKDTVLVQFCVQPGNGSNVPFVIKCAYLSLNQRIFLISFSSNLLLLTLVKSVEEICFQTPSFEIAQKFLKFLNSFAVVLKVS